MTGTSPTPLPREEILAMRGSGVEFGNDEIEGDWNGVDPGDEHPRTRPGEPVDPPAAGQDEPR